MQQSLKAAVSGLSCHVPVSIYFFEQHWALYSDLSAFHQDISAVLLIPSQFYLLIF